MKLNQEEMKRLASLDDAALWNTIKSVAAEHGYNLTKKPSNEDLMRVRGVLRGDEKLSLSEATRLIKKYKKENGIK